MGRRRVPRLAEAAPPDREIKAMQTENRLFDDFARMASGALSTLSGLREEIETRVRERFERLLTEFDLVTREEFEAVREMAAKARAEQEELAARLAALEEQRAGGRPAATGTAGTAARKRAAPRKRTAAAGAAAADGGTTARGGRRGRRAAATPAAAGPGGAGTPPVAPEV
jgi:BMFP domain-containing protein YqiC